MSFTTPSRRGILAATAWAVPSIVVASSAPAFAASGNLCVPLNYEFNWSTGNFAYTSSTQPVGSGAGSGVVTATALPPAPRVGTTVDQLKITVSNAFTGNAYGLTGGNGNNMVVPNHEVGGLGSTVRGLEMYQGMNPSRARATASERSVDSQTVTVNFDRPVTGLVFTITDIDSSSGQFSDRVELSGGTFTHTKPKYNRISGEGTAASPWQATGDGNISHITSNQGNVVVTFPGTISSFSVKFWNADGGTKQNKVENVLNNKGAQAIFLSNFTFRASSCKP